MLSEDAEGEIKKTRRVILVLLGSPKGIMNVVNNPSAYSQSGTFAKTALSEYLLTVSRVNFYKKKKDAVKFNVRLS